MASSNDNVRVIRPEFDFMNAWLANTDASASLPEN